MIVKMTTAGQGLIKQREANVKRLELQYFDWPIPVFIRFIKANHDIVTQVFSRCLISLCSSHFDNHLYFYQFPDHDLSDQTVEQG